MAVVGATTPVDRLRFEQGVSRELVHKAAVEQVLVTDFVELGELEFASAGQAPRAHAYFNDAIAPHYDALMMLESGRQAFVTAAHAMVDVPRASQFTFVGVDLQVERLDALRLGAEPASLVWCARLIGPRILRGEPVGAGAVGELLIDGVRCAAITGVGVFMSERMYRILRRRPHGLPDEAPVGTGARLSPAAVGRRDPANVVIGELEHRDGALHTGVVVDRSHTTFFDHPLDHVPAMLLVEALRQTAVVAVAQTHGLRPEALHLSRVDVKYHRYAELDGRIGCAATAGAVLQRGQTRDVQVDVQLHQGSATLAAGRLTLSFEGDTA